MGGDHHHHSLGIDLQHFGQPAEAFRAAVGAGREIHVQQQNVEHAPARQACQMGRIAQGLHAGEVAFQQQAGGLQHILIVVGDQDSGIEGRHRGHCSETDRCPPMCTRPHGYRPVWTLTY